MLFPYPERGKGIFFQPKKFVINFLNSLIITIKFSKKFVKPLSVAFFKQIL